MKAVSCVGIVACALGAAACAHNGISDRISLTASCTERPCGVTSVKSSEYGPTYRQWKNVITDWIHGGIDHKHSCAAVKAAILHLPTNSSRFSTVNEDLAAYARKVC